MWNNHSKLPEKINAADKDAQEARTGKEQWDRHQGAE